MAIKTYQPPLSTNNNAFGSTKSSPVPYGLHVPYNQGYDARSRAKAPTAEQGGSSGNLYSPTLGAKVEMWITDISADFSISGEIGQSRMLREFFPHSFNDVTLQITGNVASTQEYNRLAAFVRQAHWQGLANVNNGDASDQTLTFTLYNNTPTAWKLAPHTTDVAITGDPAGALAQGLTTAKGAHRPWVVTGYIQEMQAGAERWEVAPQFTIDFIVTTSALTAHTGLWSDTAARGSVLKSFLQLFSDTKLYNNGNYVTSPIAPPTPPQNQSVQKVIEAVGQGLSWTAAAVPRVLPF